MQAGWTERQTADILNTYLMDHGVKRFFHKSFVWFGDRTRFAGVKRNTDYLPTSRIVQEGEICILDVAPIYQGYIADVGYTTCLGESIALQKAQVYLQKIRTEILKLFQEEPKGKDVWEKVDQSIQAAGYDNIHALYPFSVLGHRVHYVEKSGMPLSFINFGWQSYWAFLSRGLFGQLLNQILKESS